MGEKINYSIEEIKKTLAILKPNDALYEIRILTSDKVTFSGYFKGTDNLEVELKKLDLRSGNVNFFYTLQTIDEACYSREQHERFRQKPKATTSDEDIVAYNWLLIDIDPKRRPEVSSSEEELTMAKKMAERIAWYLKRSGFKEPVIALSGNGVHLMYGISLANTIENRKLCEDCLKALSYIFSDDHAEVDVKVFNPGRISKLYGSVAQKGANTKERPHRMSRLVVVPTKIETTPKILLEKLAAVLPKEDPKPIDKKHKKQYEEFDLDKWISDHGISIAKVNTWNDCKKYVLTECAFDSSHKAPDACILQMKSGAIAYKCLHNSCAGRTWQDFRLLYEPDAYDKESTWEEDDGHIERGYAEYKNYNRNRTDIAYKPLTEETEKEPLFQTAKQIFARPEEERVCIGTGFRDVDRLTGGLAKGEITVVSGLRGAGKSTWLSQLLLNFIQQEKNTLVYSGELKDTRFMNWIALQAAGEAYILHRKGKFDDTIYYITNDIRNYIAEWMGDRLQLYNNRFGNNFKNIADVLPEYIKKAAADLVLIDNMMCLDLTPPNGYSSQNKNELQTDFVGKLKEIALYCNCHIIFVAHPRKAQGFLRLDDISGTGNISNLVDNAFIIHRNNEDFVRLTKQYYKWKDTNNVYSGTNVIEICKDRENGTQDKFIPLYYQTETKRMLNYTNESIRYSWQELLAKDDKEDKAGFIPVNEADVDIPFEDV
ncbi:MAG: AAA family ATPase [Lachnospiraceae bacterium]|nr:AAA family ATPase [Lachnospiraceae bacterium]